jgi:hypothetical protein
LVPWVGAEWVHSPASPAQLTEEDALRRIRGHLTFANAMSLVAVFIALGGAAYAVNTVRSSDIVDGEVKIADIGRGAVGTSEVLDDSATGGGLTAADLRSGSVGPAEAAGLTGADIANASSGSDNVNANSLDGIDSSGLVQGRGKLLASRFILAGDDPDRTLFEIPGFGRLSASCGFAGAILFTNTTNGHIDYWIDVLGESDHRVIPPFGASALVSSDGAEASTVALGFGDDPGARRTATLHAFVAQAGANQPCTVQAQGMLWTNR